MLVLSTTMTSGSPSYAGVWSVTEMSQRTATFSGLLAVPTSRTA
jgi:hypothetical protein